MTPKTLDKYIAALKKKAAAGGWSADQYLAELDKIKNEMAQQYLDDKITSEEYTKVSKQLKNAEKNPGLLGKPKPAAQPVTQTGMTHEEYIGLWKALNKKKKAGLITKDEYYALGAKLDTAYKDKKSASETEKEIGCDPGTLATDDAIIKLGKQFKKIYGDAAKDMQTKLDEFLKKAVLEMDDLNQKLLDGTITPEEFDHLKLLTLQKKILGQKVDQLTGVMTNANKKAMAAVNGEMLGVFAENAAWQSYQITQDAKMDLMFSIYDEHTAENLIKNNPKLLPPRKGVNGQKDQAWNRKMLAGTVAQAVIQGESIPKLARRIAADLSEKNSKAMMRYARTAMTGAQNAGRIEMLHRAEGMGIKVKKRWLATLDSRTRDSHQHMDGVSIGVDEEFKTPLGSKMQYPGDVNGKGGDVWNCRCTLVYDYEGFPNDPTADMRRDNETGEEIANMNYDEWKAAKSGSVLNDLSNAKFELADIQKEFVAKKVNPAKVYDDLWKDPVTLDDYPAKKGSIQAKRDYFETEIDKYQQAQAAGATWATDEKIKGLQKKLKLLNEFEKHGQLLEKRNAALKKIQALYDKAGYGKTAAAPEIAKKAKKAAKKAAPAAGGISAGTGTAASPTQSLAAAGAKKTPFGPEAYTKERKDKALWSDDKRYVDSIMRPHTGEVWSKATAAEKDAIIEYTQSYHKFNEPLRGIEYGTSVFKGVGNTDLNAGHANNGKRMNAMTDLIDKCSYDHDMWLQRGCGYGGMDKFFQCSPNLLQNGSQEELRQALLGTTPTEYAFGSMGSAKGKGFSTHPIIMNIYAPSGTKMMYVEPFSHYGGHDYNWDGKRTQSHFGDEFETLLQQGTQFRITKIERPRRGGTIYFDLEVINQDNQQRWKK
ncbi:MAG: hypothetical protein IKQ01_06480 [Bacteroidales bacterium]|nr:hypothetical protein [Bacteroidales bacterium]